MKNIVVALIGILILATGYYWFSQEARSITPGADAAADYKNASYTIEGREVKLMNGQSEIELAPGSASRLVTTYFGNEAKADLNGDGKEDVIFLVTQTEGGSGTFYYAVAALSGEGGYRGTNAILLGDRILPQSTSIIDGVISVNYGERKIGEPMTAEVTVGVSRQLKIADGKLVEASAGLEWLISDRDAFAESGAPLTSVTLRANGVQRNIGTYEGTCFVIEGSAWQLLPGEKSGVICWWAGGGTEIGVFEENGKLVVKTGDVDEGTAEGGGVRGNFTALLAL